MATSVLPSPGADAGLPGGGSDAELGSLLSAGWDAAADATGIDAGQDTPGATGTEEPQQFADPASTEQPQQDPTAEGADANAANPDPESPFQLTPDGKSYLVPKTQLPQFQAAQKFHDSVSQFFGSPQEAQTSYYQASDHRAMGNDWMSGTPEAIQGVLDHWAGANHGQNPAVQQRYQQSFQKMAELVPGILQKMNPQAHESFVSSMIGKAVDLAYDRAARTGNPEDFKKAQELDWGATGQYKTELPKIDPQAQQLSQQQQQMQQFEQRQAAAYQRDVAGFNQQAVEGAKFTKLSEMIDKTLATVKDRYTPVAYEDLKAGIHRSLVDKMKSETEWWREHGQTFGGIMSDYKHTWSQGNPGAGLQPRVAAYIQSFVSRAQRHLPAIAAPRINAATKAAVSRTQQGQFAGNKPQQNRPAAAPNTPQNGKPQGRMPSEQWDKEFASMFNG